MRSNAPHYGLAWLFQRIDGDGCLQCASIHRAKLFGAIADQLQRFLYAHPHRWRYARLYEAAQVAARPEGGSRAVHLIVEYRMIPSAATQQARPIRAVRLSHGFAGGVGGAVNAAITRSANAKQ
jgi:hypothetical protein